MAEKRLVAYETVPPEGWKLEAAPPGRAWMNTTAERSAYRCLPLLMASQAGWLLSSPASVQVRWNGRAELGAVEIWRCVDSPFSPDYLWPISHFGQGIVTWTLPWLFRTSPGYNLLVRGPANSVKDGIAPLEGLVQTDWAVATATMNWKITRPDKWITFEAGEPVCMVVPQAREFGEIRSRDGTDRG